MSSTTPVPTTLLGDIDKLKMRPDLKNIHFSSDKSFAIYNDKYFAKILQVVKDYADSDLAIVPADFRLEAMAYEISMMEAAGEDCAVQPLGRIVLKGNIVGHITHLGVCYPPHVPPEYEFKELLCGGPFSVFPPSEQFIDGLVALVHRLHAHGILHGDIKPSNVIYCKQSARLLFCDLESACRLDSTSKPHGITIRYCPPTRPYQRSRPVTKEDDLYATGISVWEIASMQIAFADIDDDDIDDVIWSGFQPNVYAIGDPAVRRLVQSLLNAGFPHASAFAPYEKCIEGETVYADCHANPPHTHTKTVHLTQCKGGVECDKNTVYRILSLVSHVENVPCQSCA